MTEILEKNKLTGSETARDLRDKISNHALFLMKKLVNKEEKLSLMSIRASIERHYGQHKAYRPVSLGQLMILKENLEKFAKKKSQSES